MLLVLGSQPAFLWTSGNQPNHLSRVSMGPIYLLSRYHINLDSLLPPIHSKYAAVYRKRKQKENWQKETRKDPQIRTYDILFVKKKKKKAKKPKTSTHPN